jgi:hypothetical protein
MTRARQKESLIAQSGASAVEISRGLRRFSTAARLLSSDHPRLINKYPQRWVGVYGGKVAANAKTLSMLLSRLKDKGIPPSDTIIRFIDRNPRTFIL